MIALKLLKSCRRFSIVLFIAIYAAGCHPTTTDPQPNADQYLVSSNPVATLTKDQLTTQAAAVNPAYALLLKQGISVIKLVYNTKN